MSSLEKTQLALGFMPLSDCAPLVVAKELGFFQQQGLDVMLLRQNSWATLRDKLHAGLLDAAQMLAPMPFASHVGSGVEALPMRAPFVLSYNGNGITLSKALFDEVCEQLQMPAEEVLLEPVAASTLAAVIAKRVQCGEKLKFATVFPFSCHYYQLTQWLEQGGIDLKDVEISIIPPSGMVTALADKLIDGFCVGSPWNAAAVRLDIGATILTSNDIWPGQPEKVLGVTKQWQEQHPNTLIALTDALRQASEWLKPVPNRFEVARWLCQAQYLNTELDVVAPALIGSCLTKTGVKPRDVIDHTLFSVKGQSNELSIEQGQWLLQQMQANGHIPTTAVHEKVLREVITN